MATDRKHTYADALRTRPSEYTPESKTTDGVSHTTDTDAVRKHDPPSTDDGTESLKKAAHAGRRDPALCRAAAAGDTLRCIQILDKCEPINRGKFESFAMSMAAQNGHFGACELLLSRGAYRKLHEPLEYAAARGYTYICELLLAHGACIRKAALFEAVTRNHTEVCKMFLAHGVALKTYNRGVTALHIAAAHDNMELYDALVAHGANEYAVSASGVTPVGLLSVPLEQRHAVVLGE